MIGEQVEQYLVQRKLGNGAMGSIYLALDTTLDRAVALKFVLSDFDNHPGMARRFLEEAKVLASLNRPNIPILYGYFIWRDHGVMAMEYVDGETFESMVSRRGPIPASVCVPLVKQALLGLASAHRRGIVHRDLKPGNLMLDKEGTVKVVDFGIAKKIEVEVRLTATNTTVGTPMYMAPEQIMGKPVDPRTDIYSMGIVLYELLAGQVPFNATSLYEIQAAHVQRMPEPPTVHYPHIPQPVVDAVMKALQKSPADRFASAEDFMHALPELEPLPIPPAPPSIPDTVILRQPSGHQVPTPALKTSPASPAIATQPKELVVVPPPPAVPTIVTREVAAQEAPLAVATQNGTGRNKPLIIGLAVSLALIIGAAAWFVFKPAEEKPSVAVLNPVHKAPPASVPDESASQPPAETTPPAGTKPPIRSTEAKPKQKTPQTRTEARNVDNTAPNVTPPAPVTATDLSGQWRGFYFNKASQEKTTVRLSIHEVDGGRITGNLQFQTPDNTAGQCDLNGSSYQGGTLRLLTHCTPKVPYLNTYTTFQGVQPTATLLSGTVFSSSQMIVSLQRN